MAAFLAGLLVGYWVCIVVIEINIWMHRHD